VVGGWVSRPALLRGASKKKIDGPPRAFAKSQTHPPTIRLFSPFPWLFLFFCVRFWAFLGSRHGEFKKNIQIFLQKSKKSMSKTSPKISTKALM
jgi:hypothetical protein